MAKKWIDQVVVSIRQGVVDYYEGREELGYMVGVSILLQRVGYPPVWTDDYSDFPTYLRKAIPKDLRYFVDDTASVRGKLQAGTKREALEIARDVRSVIKQGLAKKRWIKVTLDTETHPNYDYTV